VFSSAGVVGCSPSATTTELTSLDDDGFGFRTIPSDAWQGRALARTLAQVGVETAAVVHVDGRYGRTVAESFTEWFEELGGSVTTSVPVPQGADDYADALETAVQTDPAALAAAAFPASGIPLLGQYYDEFGGSVERIALSDGLRDSEVGAALAAYDTSALLGATPGRGPGRDQFVELHRDEYGEPPGRYAAQAYDAVVVGLLANAAAGGNYGAAIRDRIRTVANPPGAAVGPADVPEVVRELSEGGSPVNYQGAGSVVDFDADGNVAVRNYATWQFEGEDPAEVEVFELPEQYRPEPGGSAADTIPGGRGREMRIGLLIPKRGPLSSLGDSLRKGARLPLRQLRY